MIARALGRLFMIPLGLLLGVITATAVLVTLGLEITTHTLSTNPDDPARLEALLDMGFGFLSIAAASSILPALILAVIGEIARIRSALYYIVGGGIALALLPFVMGFGVSDAPLASVPPRALAVLATAGFAGGFVYWLVAGRRA